MNKATQILSRETFMLPLVICVVLPVMAGAWWRHSYGVLQAQAATAVTTTVGTCDVSRTLAESLHDQ